MTQPQSRLMLGGNTLGFVLTLVNVGFLAKDDEGRPLVQGLERGYYVVDSLIYLCMLGAPPL